jgi:hypothetical protein
MHKLAMRIATIALAIGALVVSADARSFGGGKGGGGGGKGGGVSIGHRGGGGGAFRGGSVGRSFAVRSGGSRAAFSRSFAGPRSARSFRGSHRIASRGVSSRRALAARSGVRRSAISRSAAGRRAANIRAANLRGANTRAAALRAGNLRSSSLRLGQARSGHHFHRRLFARVPFRAFSIGWYGPLFWPYAYDDVFYYAFWPYGGDWYDDPFWAYGYGDIYGGIFSPYGYDDLVGYVGRPTRVARVPSGDGEPRRNAAPVTGRLAEMCGQDTADVSGLPIEQMQQAVQPNPTQRAALDELGNASVKASQLIRQACPADFALTPAGRLEAMEKRLASMAQAIALVRPPLEKFYGLLNDEQKARLNAIGEARSDRDGTPRRQGLSRPCGDAPGVSDFPTADIERAVRPTQAQQTALQDFKSAVSKAAETIKASCPATPPVTPTARMAAAETRIQALLASVRSVRGALETFYSSLSDEQKAKFNGIGRPQSGRGQG